MAGRATVGGMKIDLKDLLKRRGMRLSDLARLTGADKGSVTRWGQRRVPPERVPEIERVTGIPRYELRPDLWEKPTA